MFSRIFKCVSLPGNNFIQLVNNTQISHIISNKGIRFHGILKNVDKLSLLVNKYEGVDNLSSSKKLVTLRLVYSSLNNKYNNKNGLLTNKERKSDYYYSILNDILASLNRSKDLNFKIKESLVSVLISIAKVSNNVEIKGKINEFIQGLILSSSEQEIVKLLKQCIKSKYKVKSTKLIYRIRDSKNIESEVCFNLYWCLSTLGAEFSKLTGLLEKIISHVESTSIVNNLKLLNSLHSLFCKVNPEGVKNNVILSSHKNSNEEASTMVNQQSLLDKINIYRSSNCGHYDHELSKDGEQKLLNETIEYVKRCLLSKTEEFDNSRAIINFIYYITSTINNFTICNYTQLLERMLRIISDRSGVAIEGLIQLVWSLQNNNVYTPKLLQMLISEFDDMLEASIGTGDDGKGFRRLNTRQISLFLYNLAYFNMLNADLSMKSLSYLKDYASKHTNRNVSEDVLNQVNILWAICISNVNSLKGIYKDVVQCLNTINWDLFAIKSEFEDLRKVMQITALLKLENGLSDLNIPDSVVKMVETSGNTSVDYRVTSVTQDKVRRVLQSKGLDFKCEYEINSQISVDFIVFPPKDIGMNVQNAHKHSLNGRLVIEIDGPFHYNLLLDPGSSGVCYKGDEIAFGNLKLTQNGKTIYRNEILKRLGYSIVSIPWFVGYQKSFYHTIEDILNRHLVF
ncbi:uncharacterized protein TOT_010000320 [Theileria orientalis strain Shintoku]|uniref:RAP domain-containing protein n=1 Tax=Theileria orientalis strain Shintoku TaxID=869250 RepID=J4C7D6_THEOR|nr:uncharacterized protein TOT_010000320 [Theileria orientalis strain Shintoku]BAM38853.1 uncharacterized protein TOT_010000320 [Theileria orientalis strain Shintoku]|eukprot:XP_009689154.1 uncharacterized protein TOT_010000320 [Theileria orientalis strain Shintoku]